MTYWMLRNSVFKVIIKHDQRSGDVDHKFPLQKSGLIMIFFKHEVQNNKGLMKTF